jgi:pyruvate/2-oxoacid:ferredoxin oxidoreductase beta subunit
MSQLMIKDQLPREQYLTSGHLACPGCGGALAMNTVLKALGSETVVILPACCWSIIAGPWPQSSLKVPLYHTAFETGAAVASGVKAALVQRGDHETTVMVWAGDGGTFDIGLQALSGAAERNEDILYCCYDNEAYMNTGIQRSSSTPWGAWTTTTPAGHPEAHPKKDILSILAAHRIPYAATATVAYPVDLVNKVAKAKAIRGMCFIHIFSPCPPGWKTLAVHSGASRRSGGALPPDAGPVRAPDRRADCRHSGNRRCQVGSIGAAGGERDVDAPDSAGDAWCLDAGAFSPTQPSVSHHHILVPDRLRHGG